MYNSRRMCNCCRLAKCFRVGMQKSLIRTESEKESRKEIVQQTRQRRAVLNQTFTHDPVRIISNSFQYVYMNIFSSRYVHPIFFAYHRVILDNCL